MSKGSHRRPSDVPDDQVEKNWQEIFQKHRGAQKGDRGQMPGMGGRPGATRSGKKGMNDGDMDEGC